MRIDITFTNAALAKALHDSAGRGGEWVERDAGLARHAQDHLEVLCAGIPIATPAARVLVHAAAGLSGPTPLPLAERTLPLVALEIDEQGECSASSWGFDTAGRHALAALRLPGMPPIPLHAAGDASARLSSMLAGSLDTWRRDYEGQFGQRSRLAGALHGVEAIDRAAALPVAVVGCGSNGSLLAEGLARLGHPLTLIDPDRIERGNLGTLAASPGDIGRPKADALAERIGGLTPCRTLVAYVAEHVAVRAIARCALLVTAVDNDSARALAARLAAAYLKPHLDVATGVLAQARGGDIRLTFPGEGCLQCLGGFATDSGQSPMGSRYPWQKNGRLGSLGSLNGIAANFAVRLIEETFLRPAAVDTTGQWWRIDDRLPAEFGAARLSAQTKLSCHFCEHAGRGDDFSIEYANLPQEPV